MANVIRHKRGTSNPAAGDFNQTAELLVNTTDGGLFTKTDGGSVVEIGGDVAFNDLTGKTAGTGDYSTNGDIVSGRGSGGVALTINDGHGNANVTWNHQNGTPEQNGNAARIEVNTDDSTNAQMYFELKSGVTANTNTGLTSVLTLSETQISALKPLAVTGNITVSGTVDGRDLAADGSKLDGIESGATADQTASEILTAIKTVDGSGSGLDADTVDGLQAASFIRSDTQDSVTGPIEFSAGTLQTYDPTSGTAGSDTATDAAIALGSGHRIVGHSDGYIRSLLEWNSGSDITIGQGGTSLIGGINFISGSSATNVKVNGNLVLHAGNYTTYAPTKTGTGASGTWGISVTGNANTATTLQTARTIGLGGDLSGSASFNGSSNITISATVADDSHNHVVSNIDGLQTTLNSKASLSGATFTGEVQINARLDVGAPGNDHEIRIYKTDNNVSDHIQFYNGTTRMGEIGCHDTTWLRINQVTNKNIYTPRYIRADAGFFVDGTSKGINGSGNFIGGTIAGASDYGTLLRSNANDTATGILTFNAACRGQVDTLTSASTITPNFNNSNNFKVTLATNTTIANPSNLTAGQSGAIAITYSGNRTVAFGSYWKFPGGTAPTATGTSGKVDVLVY